MVEISMSGSGEGPVWETGRGYSTVIPPLFDFHRKMGIVPVIVPISDYRQFAVKTKMIFC